MNSVSSSEAAIAGVVIFREGVGDVVATGPRSTCTSNQTGAAAKSWNGDPIRF